MNNEQRQKIVAIFGSHAEVQLAYFFGSRARGDAGPMADYDFAVQLANMSSLDQSNLKFKLMSELSELLKTDSVDLVVLNSLDKSELKFFIVYEGQLIFEREPFRIVVEPQIMNEYFDFRAILLRHGLTKKVYVE